MAREYRITLQKHSAPKVSKGRSESPLARPQTRTQPTIIKRGDSMAREYRIRMGAFDIGKWEYREVEALARRYRSMKRRASVLEQCNSQGVHGEQYAAMIWECAIVEKALRETDGGKWEKALALSCCDGVAYVDIDPIILPTSCRNEFFGARREFFWRLWTLRQKAIGAAVKSAIEPRSDVN